VGVAARLVVPELLVDLLVEGVLDQLALAGLASVLELGVLEPHHLPLVLEVGQELQVQRYFLILAQVVVQLQ